MVAKINFEPVDPALNRKRDGQCRCPQCQNDAETGDSLCGLHRRMVDKSIDEVNELEDAWTRTPT